MMASCAKDKSVEEFSKVSDGQTWEGIYVNDESGNGPETRTALRYRNKSGMVVWEVDDKIDFYDFNCNMVGSATAESSDYDYSKEVYKAIFKQADPLTGTPYFAFNHSDNLGNGIYSGVSTAYSGNAVTVYINSEQSGTFSDAFISAAKVVPGSQTLKFYSLCPVFEMMVEDPSVKEIVIRDPESFISGGVEIEFGNNGILGQVAYELGDNTSIRINIDEPGTYYAALCPHEIPKNTLSIEYLDASGNTVSSFTYSKGLNLKAGQIYRWGDAADHDISSNTLPPGEVFNGYMEEVAGGMKNIEWIQFSRNVSNPQGGIQIAKDVYMSKVVNTLGKTGIAIKTSNAKFYAHQDCSKMFADCYNAENIYGLQYLDTSSTTDMWAMFSSCEKLTELDLSNFDTSNVTHMGDMFYSCEDLTELDLSSFDTGNVEYMGYMFEWCYALKNIYLGGSFVIPDGCFVDEALLGCKVTMYGTTEEMESFVKALVPGNDYSPGCLHFAIDMGDAGWWSAWNVGAEKPEDYGSYFAWGETEEKTDYSTSNYKWGVYDEDAEPLYGMTKYTGNITGGDGLTTLKFDDDPTCQKWGSNWRTPTLDDFKKLFGRSERTWDDEKKGYIVKCKETGNSIFLPAAGIRGKDGTLGSVGSNGWYWSSSIRKDSPCYSNNILFQPTQVVYYNFYRYFGMSVRPIANY